MQRFLAITLTLAMCGCASPDKPTTNRTNDQFQLHTAPDGRVYRIDKTSGASLWLDGVNFRAVGEPTMPQLVVGKVYRSEDGTTSYRYQGVGLMEKWGLDKYNKPTPQETPTKGKQ